MWAFCAGWAVPMPPTKDPGSWLGLMWRLLDQLLTDAGSCRRFLLVAIPVMCFVLGALYLTGMGGGIAIGSGVGVAGVARSLRRRMP